MKNDLDADLSGSLLLPVWLTGAAVLVGAALLFFDPAIGPKAVGVLLAVGVLAVATQLVGRRIALGRLHSAQHETRSRGLATGSVPGANRPDASTAPRNERTQHDALAPPRAQQDGSCEGGGAYSVPASW